MSSLPSASWLRSFRRPTIAVNSTMRVSDHEICIYIYKYTCLYYSCIYVYNACVLILIDPGL